MLPQIIHILRLSGGLVAPDFEVNWTAVRAARWQVHRGDRNLLDYCTFGL